MEGRTNKIAQDAACLSQKPERERKKGQVFVVFMESSPPRMINVVTWREGRRRGFLLARTKDLDQISRGIFFKNVLIPRGS